MAETEIIDPRYPIGKSIAAPFDEKTKESLLSDILFLPRQLEYAILNLDEAQLSVPYREGGWTIKQVVHHVADSHMNAYIRFKLGLTEEQPTIKPYMEERWAELPDTFSTPINMSLTLLHALHHRWYELLKLMDRAQWDRTVMHPEHGKIITLWQLLGIYAWHGKHHTAHITNLRRQMGW
jgi:uncharacterized damage-inducible protein DinB